jgi:hypothetical protein
MLASLSYRGPLWSGIGMLGPLHVSGHIPDQISMKVCSVSEWTQTVRYTPGKFKRETNEKGYAITI